MAFRFPSSCAPQSSAQLHDGPPAPKRGQARATAQSDWPPHCSVGPRSPAVCACAGVAKSGGLFLFPRLRTRAQEGVQGVLRATTEWFSTPTGRRRYRTQYPPPLVQATVDDQKLTKPTPSVAWTRVLLTHYTVHGTYTRAKYATLGHHAQISFLDTKYMNIMHLKPKVSDSTHSTQ